MAPSRSRAREPAEADSVRRSYPESVVFPYPRRPCRIEIFGRNARGRFEKRFSQNIDPASCFVAQFSPRYEAFEVAYNGNPAHRVVIVLLPVGYGAGERAKFESACREFAREFFSYSPYKENAARFNVRAVWAHQLPIRRKNGMHLLTWSILMFSAASSSPPCSATRR